jgi:glutamate decarboxylase
MIDFDLRHRESCSSEALSETDAALSFLQWFGPDVMDSASLRDLERLIAQNPLAFFNPETGPEALEALYSSVSLPEGPMSMDEHVGHLQTHLLGHAMPTAAPSFIGHMTSALPSYLPSLAKIMAALNQNQVKLETSRGFTPMERQVLGMLHQLIYGFDDAFYRPVLHSGEHALGAFCSGGTTANITGLWAARNNLLAADGDFTGVARAGLAAGLLHYGYAGLAILVSERGHYSLRKAADALGIGQDNLIAVPTDSKDRIRLDALQASLEWLRACKIKPLAIVGIAGTTETGAVDDLAALANIAEQERCHYHIDAAWGGASLLSTRQRPIFKGIERADSVVIDAHKQLYAPMGAGLVFFKCPTLAAAISQHANYIVRKDSKDLGRHTLEGSRSAMAMLLHANLHILGRRGYEQLIDRSVDLTKFFAEAIRRQDDFELISEPQLCLLTYRYVPAVARQALQRVDGDKRVRLQEALDALTEDIQERQRAAGHSFVSRTRLTSTRWSPDSISVFRVVLANPLTNEDILLAVLQEQRELALSSSQLASLLALAQS